MTGREPVMVHPSKLDNLGRLVIAKDIRLAMGILPGSMVDVYFDGTEITIRKSQLHSELQNRLDLLQGQVTLLAKGDSRDTGCAQKLMAKIEEMQRIINEHT